MNKNDNSNHPFNEIQSTPRKPSQVSPAVKALHNNFQVSIRDLKRDLVRSIYYLRVIYDRKIFRLLGYDNIREYAAEAGGLNECQCKAFLKIGEKLGDLPTMKRSLEEGSISWHKASQIVDLAEPENETELIEAAKSLSTSKLKELVRPRITSKQRPQPKIQPEPLILPTAKPPNHEPVKPADSPCYVTFKFSPEQYSLWAAFNARSAKLSKEEKLLEALKGQASGKFNSEHSDSGFLIIIHECPRCGQATISNNRGTFHPPKALLESARCDAIIEDEEAKRRRVISPRLRRQVLKRDSYRCQASGCQNTHHLQIHHRIPASQGGSPTPDNLITLCSQCHRRLHEAEIDLRAANRDPAELE